MTVLQIMLLVSPWIYLASATCQQFQYTAETKDTFPNQAKCRWYENNEPVVCVRVCNTNSACYGYSEQGSTCLACFSANVSVPDPSFQLASHSLSPDALILSKIDIDECANPSYCLNGGACIDAPFTVATCSCVAGFTGSQCETDIDECVGHSCQNGATCVDGINSYTCTCVLGYGGNTCQTNINDCSPNPCQNSGSCTDGLNSFTCNCRAWTTGSRCENILYTIGNLGTSWPGAKSYCSSQGKQLAMIADSNEAATVTDLILNSGISYSNCLAMWVDGQKIGSKWTWSDGSTNRWLGWGAGEPNNSPPVCLSITVTPNAPSSRRFLLSDGQCSYPGNDHCPLCE